MNSEPRVRLLRLWERESRNGRRYFAGFLGALGVVMFRDEKARPREGVIAEWEIFVSERETKPSASATTAPRRSPARRQAAPQQPAGGGEPFYSDDISDIGRGEA